MFQATTVIIKSHVVIEVDMIFNKGVIMFLHLIKNVVMFSHLVRRFDLACDARWTN
jgi:hypothetical protein